MNIYAIGDLHLSGDPPAKPMDIFGPHWADHWRRVRENWLSAVNDEDIVFLVGDMSWALRLHDALCDLKSIADMPGKKYMIRGNHDYWWASARKMNAAMNGAVTFLQGRGTACVIDTPSYPHIVAFGGTRGYLCPGDSDFVPDRDRSIYDREIMRTEAALKEMDSKIHALLNDGVLFPPDTEAASIDSVPVTRILLLHYPPFNENNEPSEFTGLMDRYNVNTCIFGHLHDENSFSRIPDTFGNTALELVSADYLQFQLKRIL